MYVPSLCMNFIFSTIIIGFAYGFFHMLFYFGIIFLMLISFYVPGTYIESYYILIACALAGDVVSALCISHDLVHSMDKWKVKVAVLFTNAHCKRIGKLQLCHFNSCFFVSFSVIVLLKFSTFFFYDTSVCSFLYYSFVCCFSFVHCFFYNVFVCNVMVVWKWRKCIASSFLKCFRFCLT